MTSDTARQLLGGDINGHDVVAGHANRSGLTLLTTPHRWQWRPRERRERREVRPGSRLIGTGGVLLFLLGLGLLAVSFAAQYQYVLHERHQHIASLIEAGALDVGLIIFSLLALGLARAGLSAKIERAAVIGCAIGSAVMNYAAADVTSPRSVLAYCMPPVFLAFVVDRVVRTIQRHVLGMDEARSPWSVLADTARRITRFWLLSVLYSLRFVIDRRGTWAGVKRAIILATPLPEAPAARPNSDRRRRIPPPRGRGTGKTAQLLALAEERHGDLAAIPLADVSKIATAIASEVGLHPASARTALLGAVRAALPAGGSDSK
jgi:hypothetical protein